jgi:regulation of enolase protein 1 (concanavalin A-like superfamily)
MSAAGDVYQAGVSSVAQNAYLNLQPAAGAEIVVHNISHSTDATLEFYDGSTAVSVDVATGSGSWMGIFLHCTNTKYYRVKNTNAAANNICADGMYTKVS